MNQELNDSQNEQTALNRAQSPIELMIDTLPFLRAYLEPLPDGLIADEI